MKIFRRILFFALTTILFGLIIWLRMRGPFLPPAFSILTMGSIIGLVIWSIAFVKSEPNLTRIALIVVLAFLIGMVILGLGSAGA
jgi:hypothetical protein